MIFGTSLRRHIVQQTATRVAVSGPVSLWDSLGESLPQPGASPGRLPTDKSRRSPPKPANLAARSSHLFTYLFISRKLAAIKSAAASFLRL